MQCDFPIQPEPCLLQVLENISAHLMQVLEAVILRCLSSFRHQPDKSHTATPQPAEHQNTLRLEIDRAFQTRVQEGADILACYYYVITNVIN